MARSSLWTGVAAHVKITAYDAPRMFVDSMTQGAFHSFEHLHEFEQLDAHMTTMKDELVFSSPLGPLGALVDRLVLKRYLTGFLMKRNQLIREVAESEAWTEFVPPAVQHDYA